VSWRAMQSFCNKIGEKKRLSRYCIVYRSYAMQRISQRSSTLDHQCTCMYIRW
jgi:hypothetical protein